MKRKRIAVITCFHGRPEISAVFMKSIAYLKACVNFIDFKLFAAVTEGDADNIDLCTQYSADIALHDNQHLGDKWNVALSLCKDWKPDYVLIMGSDDLVAPELILWYQREMHAGTDFFGVPDLFFHDTRTGQAVYFSYPPSKGRSVGAGRMISAQALEACEWHLWPYAASSSLDLACQERLETKGIQMRVCHVHRGMIIDLKSDTNIWNFERFVSLDGSIPVTEADALWWLPPNLKKDVMKLREGNSNA